MTNRVRSKSEETEFATTTGVGTYGSPWTSAEYVSKSSQTTMSDVLDSQFYARRANGEVFNNPCEIVTERRAVGEYHSKVSYWPSNDPSHKGYTTGGNVTALCLLDAVWYQYNYYTGGDPSLNGGDVAKQHALSNVDSTPYEFFEDLMEIGETVRFLRNPIAGINDLARNFSRKRRDLPGWPKPLVKDLANLWNQYRFAFMPLVQSVMKGMDALANFEGRSRPERRTAHGFCETNKVTSEEWRPWIMGPNPIVYVYDKDMTRTQGSHAAIYYEVTNPAADLNFYLGLRLKDVPVVTWELMPLSFMVDRLYNVKNMLQGLLNLADPSVSILAASLTTRTEDLTRITCKEVYWTYGEYTQVWDREPDFVDYTKSSYLRSIWVPTVADTIPTLTYRNLVSDTTKILDLLAITISRLL